MQPSQLRARYWQIIFFFGRVTLEFIWWEILLANLGLRALTRQTRSARYQHSAAQFRRLAIRLGGLLIKVGQFLSARLDVLPPEITDELAGLQDKVPPDDFKLICELAEAELGARLTDKYAWIDENPLAAASLGQVHRARLLPAEAKTQGYGEVVVKIQRPFIEQIVAIDLSALRRVGGWVKRYKPISERVDVEALIEEFARTTYNEIDYLAEGRNAETFSANFKDQAGVYVPKVIWPLTTRRVLTLENVFAINLGDYAAITAAGIDRVAVAERLLAAYMQQVFEDGFFHADPHPGNLFVTPLASKDADGNREWRLSFVDFGMVGQMPDNLRAALREAVIAVGTRDAGRLTQTFKTLGILLPGADQKLIERASAQLFDRFWGLSMRELRQIDHAEMLKFGLQFRDLMYQLPFQLPQNLLILGRTLGILSGMCTGLNPDFNLWTAIEPYATRLIAAEGVSNWQTWLAEAGKIAQALLSLPGRTEQMLTRLENGEVEIQLPRVNRQLTFLEQSVNRLSGGLVFTALLVSGAILYSSNGRLGEILMGISALPLLWTLFFARGQR